MKILALLLTTLILASCNKSAGTGAFGGLDGEVPTDNSQAIVPLTISSYTPMVDPLVLTNSSSSIFAVNIMGNVGTLRYDFIKDDTTTLQSGEDAFYNLLGSSLSGGDHEIKIVAQNVRSSIEKTFNVRKNRPTTLVTYSPATTGAAINCGSGTLTFNGIINDLDLDNYLVSWELDSVPVTGATPFVTTSTLIAYSELAYTPDCTRAGSHTLVLKIFDGYDTTEKTWSFTVNNPPPPPGSVSIFSFTPTSTPTVLTNATSATFGVTLVDGAGVVTYDFVLDNTVTLQSSGTSFFTLAGSTLSAGFHSITVTADNGTSTASHTFNIRKNTPASVSSYTPALTGNTINCSGGSITLSANYGDINLDAVSVNWKIDDVLVVPATPFTSTSDNGTSTSLTYTPDCTKAGFHTYELVLNDSYELFSQSWSVSVNNPPTPPGSVSITDFTPTTPTTILTGSTTGTFAVSVADGAGVVTYEFKKDNASVLQNTTTPYLVLDGSSLTVGAHTIKVKASNTTSYDEKIFNVRRNEPPTFVTYSPALVGSTLNCDAGSIQFDGTVIDGDGHSITKTWELDGVPVTHALPQYNITSTTNTGRLIFTPDCTKTGGHTVTFKAYDGYEYSTNTWAFTVVNPAQESLGITTPSGSSLIALSTDTTKTFTAIASSGIPPYTFTWTLKRSGFPDVVKLVESNVASSSVILNTSTDLYYGDQSLVVGLTDSTLTNNPVTPAERTWSIYKNQRPQISSVTPSTLKKINSNSTLALSAVITDTSDTFTATISRGASTCTTPSLCGLSSVISPTTTGTFSANFTPLTTFVGNSDFTLTIFDSHGESNSTQFNVNANYFSQACNDLAPGEICTLAGLPGIGDELDMSISANTGKVRIHPNMLSMHDVGGTKKNMFISDTTLHLIWYWNRNNTSIQLGPYSIGANKIKAIIGVPGFPGSSPVGSFGTVTTTNLSNFFLNYPTGVTNTTTGSGSSQVTNLYIGEGNANRVLRLQFVNSTSSANIQPSAAIAGCAANSAAPFDVAVDTVNTPNRLYVGCHQGLLRSLDLSQVNAFTTAGPLAFVANNLYGGTYADGTVSPAAAYSGFMGALEFDPVDKLLYFTETNTCRLRALSITGNATVNLLDTFSITANNIKTITGGNNAGTWCAPQLGLYSSVVATQYGALRGVIPYRLNGVLKGFFLSDQTYHRVVFVNNTASPIIIGNKSVPGYNAATIFGFNNSAGAANNNGALLGGKSSTLNSPLDLAVDNGVLFIADNGNSRIRTLVIDDNAAPPATVDNGTVGTAIGSIPKPGYNESPTLQAQLVQFNTPQGIKYDATNNRLLISDTGNRRVRSLSLATGVVDTLIGNGTAGNQASQANPLQSQMQVPRDIDIHKYGGSEFTLFVDSTAGANNNIVKALNSYGTTENVLNTDVDPGKTNTIAGIINQVTWAGGNLTLYDNQPAVVTPMNSPYGIGSDGPNNSIYISAYTDHCIHKVDSTGIISVIAGVCGTPGTTSGTLRSGITPSSARLTNPWDIEMDPLYPGNFFVIDNPNTASSYLRYVNTSGTARLILGIPVNGGTIGTMSPTPAPNYSNAIAVNTEQICYANGIFPNTTPSTMGTQSVVCHARANSGTLSLYIGNRNSPDLATPTFRGRTQKYTEDEAKPMGFGIDLINNPTQLAGPEGLTFDAEGNLYITESRGHTIRMVKRWYP